MSILGLSKGGEDHPRVGGEKLINFCLILWFQGSPPRGRGKGCSRPEQNAKQRITPAWAGKRLRRVWLLSLVEDHPRVGGEKSSKDSALVYRPGSPPRGRGKESSSSNRSNAAGITPAWAGKRCSPVQQQTMKQDHPRVGGEKISAAIPLQW